MSKKLTKSELRKSDKHIDIVIVHGITGSLRVSFKYRGEFDDPMILKVLECDDTKQNYKKYKPFYSRYTRVSYDIHSTKVRDYVHAINKVSGLKTTEATHITEAAI